MKKNFFKNTGCVILAAGEGTRMKSEMPKVLFDICGKMLIEYVLESVSKIDYIRKIYVVVGYKSELVEETIKHTICYNKIKNKLVFVKQPKLLGSGDAVKQVKKQIDKTIKNLLVISGDVPLITSETLENLLNAHISNGVDCTVLSVIMEDPKGYGRIIKDISKKFIDIVEELDAKETQKAIKEVNSGIYVFSLSKLWSALEKIKPDNKKGEYYLTDTVKHFVSKQTYLCKDSQEVKGINTRKDLIEVSEIVRNKIIEKWMLNGVTIIMPQTVYIDWNSEVEQDTKIFQGCVITNSYIGKNCVIGPYSVINSSYVKDNTSIVLSHVDGSEIGSSCSIGPFSRIRANARIYEEVKIGNFVEIKNSEIHNGSKIKHLAFIGDSTLKEKVNIGAGTITCNYDGIRKHNTYIGEKTFIGSNVSIVAPIKIGDRVIIAAGSTVTEDIPSDTLVIARAKEIYKKKHRLIKKMFYSK